MWLNLIVYTIVGILLLVALLNAARFADSVKFRKRSHITKIKARHVEDNVTSSKVAKSPIELGVQPRTGYSVKPATQQDAPVNTVAKSHDKRKQEYLEEIQQNLTNMRADSGWVDKDREAWMDATMDKKPCIGKDSFGWH